ncbi:MAG: tRNA-dihydrouridine synthase family protein [Faecalibacterium sp.]|nr:tRNA-dihydrouridine synthase family protein [Faecalibacterium sp.]
MQYYYAPLEGLTDAVARAAHCKYYPDAAAPVQYYAPFVSPTKDRTVDPRKLRDILPDDPLNQGVPLVPQVLCKDAGDMLWMLHQLAAMGYEEVNLNLGCPSGTVVAKGKGAGQLRDVQALNFFLDEVFSADLPVKLSVKTRLGIAEPEEFYRLLEVFNDYPIHQLTIHPRVQKDLYRNHPRMEVFEYALAHSKNPVVYNGSLNTAAEIAAFAQSHPQLSAIMLGRPLVANPALLRQLRTGEPADRETLHRYLQALYEGYVQRFGNYGNAIRRMKGVWNYVLCMFDDHKPLERVLRRAGTPAEYELVVEQIFDQLPLRTDAKDVR